MKRTISAMRGPGSLNHNRRSFRLGHEDIKTTLNTYGHLYPNTDQKMAEQLESEYREEMR